MSYQEIKKIPPHISGLSYLLRQLGVQPADDPLTPQEALQVYRDFQGAYALEEINYAHSLASAVVGIVTDVTPQPVRVKVK
jgi:hypothetical protein